jgi:hypothetical protein
MYIITFLVAVSIAYCVGFVTGVKRYLPFELVRSLKNKFNDSPTNDLLGWGTCEIKEISELPSSYFSVLIGHAYGASS